METSARAPVNSNVICFSKYGGILNKLSDSYRKSRRNLTIACGIGIAWSASQFELKTVAIGLGTKVDFGNASIPIVLFSLITFLFIRCTLEFAMQESTVRRWSLASIDYRITLNVVRVSVLCLGTATIVRTLDSIFWMVLSALAFIAFFLLLLFILTMILMPIRMYLRGKQGKTSAASAAAESFAYSFFISVIVYIGLIYIFGSGIYQPLDYLKDTPDSIEQISIYIFYTFVILLFISFIFEDRLLRKLFLFEPPYITETTPLEDGVTGIAFVENPEHPEYEKFKGLKPRN